MVDGDTPGSGIDRSVPHSARIWNYWLGGKDNYAIDRDTGEEVRQLFPGIIDVAQTSRALLQRMVGHLVSEAGVRQFLDIGTGLPTADNTHEIAQRLAPECRVVYVDNDPLVLAHARALLVGSAEGATAYLDADMAEPERVLRMAGETLDLARPVGLIMFGIVGHADTHAEALDIARRLLAGLPAGSYLALYSGTDSDPALVEAEVRVGERGGKPYRLSNYQQLAEYFEGLQLVEPGLVPGTQWRSTGPAVPSAADIASLGALARKP